MAKQYRHLFFDLDHTLWDFEANSRFTLADMFARHGLATRTGVHQEVFYATYIEVNNEKWKLYQHGKISKETLRTQRFPETFKVFGIEDPDFCLQFEAEYMDSCPHQTALLPGALDILDYLKNQYTLHIITNGFVETQDIKLNGSGITQYFQNVFSSEAIGANKPAPRIFEQSLRRAGAQAPNSLMIGDNLEVDVLGAAKCGIDQVYFNPQKNTHTEKPTYEVDHLLQLKLFL